MTRVLALISMGLLALVLVSIFNLITFGEISSYPVIFISACIILGLIFATGRYVHGVRQTWAGLSALNGALCTTISFVAFAYPTSATTPDPSR